MFKSSCVSILVILTLAACGGGSSGSSDSLGQISALPAQLGSGGVNASDKLDRPYVILVAFDGFRWDYQDLYDTPAMDRLGASGIRADSLIPAYPTSTFPNFYSIATGLNPARHGIVGNSFLSHSRQQQFSLNDPNSVGGGQWYGGEPVWVVAESSGMVAAAYFYVGTEAPIGGIQPSYWNAFDASIAGETRVNQVVDWLNLPDNTRPHFITLYFGAVDTAGHRYGPNSQQTRTAVTRVDGYLGQLLDGIAQSPVADQVTVILVSDHGMSTPTSSGNAFILSDFLDVTLMDVIGSGTYTYVYFESPDPGHARFMSDQINSVWTHGRAYAKEDSPGEWGITQNSRFPDVILQADPGFLVANHAGQLAQVDAGLHGWEPTFKDMHGIFLASGPRLPNDQQIDAVRVVDVYPMMLDILGLPVIGPIDGDPDALGEFLQD